MPSGDRKASTLAEPARLARLQCRFMTQGDGVPGRTTAEHDLDDLVVVGVSEDVVGPLLAQRQNKTQFRWS
jgi:hypothetical protein